MNTPAPSLWSMLLCGLCFLASFETAWASMRLPGLPTLQGQHKGSHRFKAQQLRHRSQAGERRAFVGVVLRPQAMRTDKKYLHTGVAKSPFPLKGPPISKCLAKRVLVHSSEPSLRLALVGTKSEKRKLSLWGPGP